MRGPSIKPKVKLISEDGNAFAIMGAVAMALRKAGADQEYLDQYLDRSTGGDYNHLILTAMMYVDVV